MKIKEVKRYSKRVSKAVYKLLPQLDPDIEAMTKKRLKSLIRSENSHLFIAETVEGEIAGMLTAVVYFIPTGTKFWIEDVVVDETFRGKGIGKALMIRAMEFAKIIGAGSVDLTSRPSRIAANKLYVDLGFELRETNVYRYSLKK
ncbi:MAG TPA: GNAT family N-acetyltransferase [Bacteroidales bacterium]|nr:GNAT family N-acetyltransferase [Bacteroidales bacterium]